MKPSKNTVRPACLVIAPIEQALLLYLQSTRVTSSPHLDLFAKRIVSHDEPPKNLV